MLLFCLRGTITTLACAALLGLAGCGDDDDDDAGAGGGEGATELKVRVLPQGQGGPAHEATVRCPGADDLCELVSRLEAADFAPLAPDVACTQIYGGPELARVEGTLRGEPVRAELSRVDGCEIERWERLAPLLDVVAGRG